MDTSKQDIVISAMRLLGCDLRELYAHACIKGRRGRNSIEMENRAKGDYRRFRDEHVHPEYLVEYCLDILRMNEHPPLGNVHNLSALRHGVTDINARRKPKR